nr:proclotting enzyme-like [Leptinotarsa decemlineata]
MEVFRVYIFIMVIYSRKNSSGALTNDHVCGRPIGTEFRLEEDRIVAGYDVGYYRYPWYAALIRYNSVSCGGALIGPRTIVTAAHCFKEYLNLESKGYLNLASVYTVKLGAYNICETERTRRDYTVEKVLIHEEYQKKKPYFDIALLILADDTSQYRPICLPQSELKKKPESGTVPGLGVLKYHGAMPCTLHEARLLVYNDTDCFNMIKNTGNDANAIKNAFCAGYIQGGIDTCQGDSGGPFQSMNSDGDYVLLGIVSFGFRCATPGLLGMYTDVSEYLDWIEEKTGLDAGIINAIYNKTTTTKPPITSTGLGHQKRRPHFGRPFRRPIRIVVYRNKQFQSITKSILHHPILRYT